MKKKYCKPIIIENNDLIESIYLSSGSLAPGTSTNCWDATVKNETEWDNAFHKFQIDIKHIENHNVSSIIFSIEFNAPLTECHCDPDLRADITGNFIKLKKDFIAESTNMFTTFTLWASTGDEATTKALSIGKINCLCMIAEEVTGGISTY